MLPPGPPPAPAPLSKSRLLRPRGGLGEDGIDGMWECEGGVPGSPPQQLLAPAVPPPRPPWGAE
jgi:hypothetical protein